MNLEGDLIGKYVAKLLSAQGGDGTIKLDGLAAMGYGGDAGMTFDRVEDAIDDIRQGKMVIVADDEDRENEGDLVCAASEITPETINFMTKYGRGLICVAMTNERADELGLPLMTDNNTDPQRTAFTISVDADVRFGVTTGISAYDRAKTIQVLLDPRRPTPGSPAARTHLPPSGPARRCPPPGRTDGGCRGPGPSGGASGCGGDLRDPQGRRHHGPASGAGRGGQSPRPEVHHRGPAGLLPLGAESGS